MKALLAGTPTAASSLRPSGEFFYYCNIRTISPPPPPPLVPRPSSSQLLLSPLGGRCKRVRLYLNKFKHKRKENIKSKLAKKE